MSESPLNRRKFLERSLVGIGAAAAVGSAVGCGGPSGGGPSGGGPSGEPGGEGAPAVHTGKSVRWRLASSFPRGLDTIFGAAEVLAERLEAMSGGRFEIRVYPAGELVPTLQVMDAVEQGTAHVGHTASYYYIGKNPALAFDTCVPFGLTSRQQTAWLTEGGGRELLAPLFADFGIRALPAGNTGTQMGGWFKREIGGAADLKGLKMRIPGLGGKVMSELGVTVQVLGGSDIYPALERGAIDATEWVGPYDDAKLGFHQVADYYYYPGWWEPGPSLTYMVNEKAWGELPTEYQSMFEAAAAESATVMQARYDAQNPQALEQLLAEGVQMRPFSDDLLTAAEKASFALLAAEADQDPAYRQIYDSWRRAREASMRWFSTAELAYARFAFGR